MPIARLQRWLVVQATLWSLLLVARIVWLDGGANVTRVVAAAIAVSFATLFIVLRAGRVADLLTAARIALLVVLVAVAADTGVSIAVWVALVACVLADLADGAVARRRGPTEAGAVLDMEADQLVTLALAWLGSAVVGGWLLLLPLFRYGYVALLLARGLPAHDPKPRGGDNRRARAVCAAVMAAQLAVLLPGMPPGVAVACGTVAVVALAWSFGVDLVADLGGAAAVRARARGGIDA